MFPLGVRLNNPGNVKSTNETWFGQTRLQDNKEYVRFVTPQAGIRAIMKILQTYQNEHDLLTIRQIITRWAPPSENNTQAYVDDVSIRMSIPDNYFIDLSKIEMLMTLAECIVVHEQGHAPINMPTFWYEEKIYHDAAVEVLNEREE